MKAPPSEVELTKLINRCIDNFEKNKNVFFENEMDLFKTRFGKKFQNKYKELIGLVSIINILVVLISDRSIIFKELSTEESISLGKTKFLDEIEKQGNSKEEYWTTLLKPILKSISEKEIVKLIKNSGKENEEELDLLSRDGIKESKFLSHLVSYFTLRLFAFMDAFVRDLFEFMWQSTPKGDKLYRIFKLYNQSNKLNERIKNLLAVTDKNLKLSSLIDKVLTKRDKKWFEDKAAFGVVLDIRHEIAHGYYLPEVEELKKQFYHINHYAEERLELILGKYLPQIPELHQFIMQYMPRSFEIISSDLGFMMFIIELGMACLRYLSIIEKIMVKYYDPSYFCSKLKSKLKKNT